VRALLRRKAKPNLLAWCRKHDVLNQGAQRFLTGVRPTPPADLLAALDLEWRIMKKRKSR
jgi:hypothetical protein